MEKKAQLNTILTGFVAVGAVLMLLILLIFTFATVNTGLEETKESNSVTNETGWGNVTGYQLAPGIGGNPRDFSLTTAYNATSGTVIPSSNLTITTSGLVFNATEVVYDAVNFTFVYNNDSAEITASKNAQTNTSRAIPIVGILFIILAVGAIISILIMSLLGKRRS